MILSLKTILTASTVEEEPQWFDRKAGATASRVSASTVTAVALQWFYCEVPTASRVYASPAMLVLVGKCYCRHSNYKLRIAGHMLLQAQPCWWWWASASLFPSSQQWFHKHSLCKLSVCKASGTSTASIAMLVLVGKWLPCIASLTTVTKPTQPSHINIIVAFNHPYLHCQCHPHLLWDDYYWFLCLSPIIIIIRPWRVVIFQLRVGSGRVVNLKVGLSGTLGSGSDKFSEVNWPS